MATKQEIQAVVGKLEGKLAAYIEDFMTTYTEILKEYSDITLTRHYRYMIRMRVYGLLRSRHPEIASYLTIYSNAISKYKAGKSGKAGYLPKHDNQSLDYRVGASIQRRVATATSAQSRKTGRENPARASLGNWLSPEVKYRRTAERNMMVPADSLAAGLLSLELSAMIKVRKSLEEKFDFERIETFRLTPAINGEPEKYVPYGYVWRVKAKPAAPAVVATAKIETPLLTKIKARLAELTAEELMALDQLIELEPKK